jgi:hypothetical protein
VARAAPSSTRRLAEADQFLVLEHPRWRRTRSRHDEAMVRHEPRPLPRSRSQRLPSAVRRHPHEHQTHPGAHRAKLRDLFPADPPAGASRGDGTSPPATRRRIPVANHPFSPQKPQPPKNPQLREALVKSSDDGEVTIRCPSDIGMLSAANNPAREGH